MSLGPSVRRFVSGSAANRLWYFGKCWPISCAPNRERPACRRCGVMIAERRVLVLENPGYRGASRITQSLSAGPFSVVPCPAMRAFIQLPPSMFRGHAYRSTDATEYSAVEGHGGSRVGTSLLEWKERNVFIAPSCVRCSSVSPIVRRGRRLACGAKRR